MSEISSLITLLNVGKMNIPTLSRDIKEENGSSDEEKVKTKIYFSSSNISSSEESYFKGKDGLDIGAINVPISIYSITLKSLNIFQFIGNTFLFFKVIL